MGTAKQKNLKPGISLKLTCLITSKVLNRVQQNFLDLKDYGRSLHFWEGQGSVAAKSKSAEINLFRQSKTVFWHVVRTAETVADPILLAVKPVPYAFCSLLFPRK